MQAKEAEAEAKRQINAAVIALCTECPVATRFATLRADNRPVLQLQLNNTDMFARFSQEKKGKVLKGEQGLSSFFFCKRRLNLGERWMSTSDYMRE